MKSMRGLSVNKLVGSLKKKTGGTSDPAIVTASSDQSPEAAAHSNVKAFCESRGNAKDDEVLFLPPIVEAAESSPTAAAECARLIRKYLSKDNSLRPSWQCNAIMLMRILADNPGPTFTRNLDAKFVDTIYSLLKHTKEPTVLQMTMDTLEELQRRKSYDENLELLIDMWAREKEKVRKGRGTQPQKPPRPSMTSPDQFRQYSQQNYFSRDHQNMRLPDAVELANRLEEARTTAKLLEQVVMNTPTTEILNNDLIKEFADRCMSASRSIQGYMVSTDPPPDNDTMEGLIDTNEQLQSALSQHQRAILNARKHLGLHERSENPSPAPRDSSSKSNASSDWQVVNENSHRNGSASGSASGSGSGSRNGNGKGKEMETYKPLPGLPPHPTEPNDPGRGRAPPPDNYFQSDPFSHLDDPFRDRHSEDEPASHSRYSTSAGGGGSSSERQGSSASGARGTHEGAGSQKQASYLHLDVDVSDDDDLYGSTPKREEPMYRY